MASYPESLFLLGSKLVHLCWLVFCSGFPTRNCPAYSLLRCDFHTLDCPANALLDCDFQAVDCPANSMLCCDFPAADCGAANVEL